MESLVETRPVEEPSVSWRCQRTEPAFPPGLTYIMVRGSLRMRNLTPWSAKDRERKVDSIIPGKFLGGDTATWSAWLHRQILPAILTSEPVRDNGLEVGDHVPSSIESISRSAQAATAQGTHFRISNKVNLRRNSPSILTDRSPKTKNPPSSPGQLDRAPLPACPRRVVRTYRCCRRPSTGEGTTPGFPLEQSRVRQARDDPLWYRTSCST